MDIELLKEGFYVMAIGMGTVFLFLVLMIFAMNIMSKLVQWLNKVFPEEVINNIKKKENKQSNNDAEIALAIAVALHKAKN